MPTLPPGRPQRNRPKGRRDATVGHPAARVQPVGVPVHRPQPSERPLGGYLLAFELISIHLVVVLVGAAYLPAPSGGCNANRQRGTVETSPY